MGNFEVKHQYSRTLILGSVWLSGLDFNLSLHYDCLEWKLSKKNLLKKYKTKQSKTGRASFSLEAAMAPVYAMPKGAMGSASWALGYFPLPPPPLEIRGFSEGDSGHWTPRQLYDRLSCVQAVGSSRHDWGVGRSRPFFLFASHLRPHRGPSRLSSHLCQKPASAPCFWRRSRLQC